MAIASLIASLGSSLASLLLNLWLLWLMWRQNLGKALPWFVVYIGAETVSSLVQLSTWPLGDRIYQWAYWPLEGIVLCLTVMAVRESFVRTFIGFHALQWFPWIIRTSIALIIGYSIWQTVFLPAVQANRLVSFVIALEFTVRWGIVALSIVILGLLFLFELPRSTREIVVLEGLFLYSAGYLGTIASRWVFGTKFIFFTQYLAVVGYLAGAIRWLVGLSQREEAAGFETLGLSPEQVLAEMKRYRQATARIREIVSKNR